MDDPSEGRITTIYLLPKKFNHDKKNQKREFRTLLDRKNSFISKIRLNRHYKRSCTWLQSITLISIDEHLKTKKQDSNIYLFFQRRLNKKKIYLTSLP